MTALPSGLSPRARFSSRPTATPGGSSKETQTRDLGRRGAIQPLFSSSLLDDVFSSEQEATSNGWVLPPSLMALPAVPGAPVVQTRAETRVPKDVRAEASLQLMDPYLQFMPVAAVPDVTTKTQQNRRPKDSLNTYELNLNIQNTLVEVSTTRAPAPTPPIQTPAPHSTAQEDKKEARRKFKRCHGGCVQKSCLPVGVLSVYQRCQEKCKTFCQ